MALFGRDYDRDYGAYGDWNRGPGYGPNWGGNRYNAYERDYGYGYGARGLGYDREFGRGYDRDFGYKSRWQTDYGDPFGDRTSRTPMRMIRGEYRGGYDRDYMANPASYDPYYNRNEWNRGGTWNRGYDRNFRSYGGGYDRGWF